LSDRYAGAVSKLVEKKEKKGEDVVKTGEADAVEDGPASADVLDLMKVLRQRVSPKASVSTADGAAAFDSRSKSNVHHLDIRRKQRRSGSPRAKKRRHS
jgi:non-homologous end joining protein Ku